MKIDLIRDNYNYINLDINSVEFSSKGKNVGTNYYFFDVIRGFPINWIIFPSESFISKIEIKSG